MFVKSLVATILYCNNNIYSETFGLRLVWVKQRYATLRGVKSTKEALLVGERRFGLCFATTLW